MREHTEDTVKSPPLCSQRPLLKVRQSMQEMPHGDFLACFSALRKEDIQEGGKGVCRRQLLAFKTWDMLFDR